MKNRPFYYYIARDRSWLTISNMLTILRIFLAPVVMVGISCEAWYLTFTVFIVASFTDLLDGYAARLLNQKSHLGTLLDPIADKFFILCCFYALVFLGSPSFHIPSWFFLLECVRELTILIGTYCLMKKDVQFEVNPSWLGKLTTFFQLGFISWLFVCRFFSWNPVKTFTLFFIGLTLLTLWSLLHYVSIGWCYLYKK